MGQFQIQGRSQPVIAPKTKAAPLPASHECETNVLSALLCDPAESSEIFELLRPDDFSTRGNSLIYYAIYDLLSDGLDIDYRTVSHKLEQLGTLEEIGGSKAIIQLMSGSNGYMSYSALNEAKIVAEKSMAREAHRLAVKLTRDSVDPGNDIFDVLDNASSSLSRVITRRSFGSFRRIDGILPQVLKELDEVRTADGKLVGIHTGFDKLDWLTTGFRGGDLVIIAGRPSHGKTTLGMRHVAEAAKYGVPSAFFSLEMSAASIIQRLLCAEAMVPHQNARSGRINPEDAHRMVTTAGILSKLPVYIDDQTRHIASIIAKIRQAHIRYGVKLVVVDYIQLMPSMTRGGPAERSRELAEYARAFKSVARDLNITVIVLSQLNRDNEKMKIPRPTISQLKESGALEESADVILLIWRPDKYSWLTRVDLPGYGEIDTEGIAEIILAKQRNGPVGNLVVAFDEQHATFQDMPKEFITNGPASIF